MDMMLLRLDDFGLDEKLVDQGLDFVELANRDLDEMIDEYEDVIRPEINVSMFFATAVGDSDLHDGRV